MFPRKKKRVRAWFWAVSIIMLLMVPGYFAIEWLTMVDFVDDPAWLVRVDDEGVVTLDTYQGRLSARLKGVPRSADPVVVRKTQAIVERVQKDKVAYRKRSDGMVEVWFLDEAGVVSLNRELSALASEEVRRQQE